MKLKKDYIVSNIADDTVVIPVGEAAGRFRGILRLNETAAFIVKCMKDDTTEAQITEKLLDNYEVERGKAERNVKMILTQLREIGAVEE